jgi:hypothetical protein
MAALPRGEVLPDRSTTRPIISIFASGGFVASDRKAGFRIRFLRKWSPKSLMIPRRTAIAMASVRFVHYSIFCHYVRVLSAVRTAQPSLIVSRRGDCCRLLCSSWH